MSEQLLKDKSGNYTVSTIRTLAGGGGDNKANMMNLCPFSESDYDTPWPYETLVSKDGSSRGLYFEAYHTEQEARDGHARIVRMVEGSEDWAYWIGKGVDGTVWGNPSLTGNQWRALEHVRVCKVKAARKPTKQQRIKTKRARQVRA